MDLEKLFETLALAEDEEGINEEIDIKAALDKAFEDVENWAFPYADIDLTRMYADFGETSTEEIIKVAKDNNFEIFEITDNVIEDWMEDEEDKDYSDYKGMIFLSPICSDLRWEVKEAIDAGEI